MKNYNKIATLMLGGVILAGFSSCQDDHFDVVGGPATNSTLWQDIKSNASLKDFSYILENTVAMRNENDKNTQSTYGQFLDGNTRLTVWAPLDGSYNAQTYKTWLELSKAYRAAGNVDSALYYNHLVQTQFVENHIAYFNYESEPEEQTIKMMNGKRIAYAAGQGTFDGVSMSGSAIATRNGVLHLLDGNAPYRYNIYDMMEAEPNLSDVYDYIASQNEKEFSENASVPGGTDENGNVQYIDSIWMTTNQFLIDCMASITNEDSSYVAVVPNNEGWPKALAKIRGLYKYKEKYRYGFPNTYSSADESASKNFTNTRNVEGDLEALQDSSARRAIVSNMFYTASQFGEITELDSTTINDSIQLSDSVKTTTGKIIYNPTPGQRNPVFGGVKPVTASNGYVYEVSDFNYAIPRSYQPEIKIPLASVMSYFARQSDFAVGANISSNLVSLTRSTIAPDDSVAGASAYLGKSYLRVERSSGAPYIELKVLGITSGKYDVYVKMFPSTINVNTAEYLGQGKEEEVVFNAELIDDEGKTLAQSENFKFKDSIADVKVFEDFQMPYSYASVPGFTSSNAADQTFMRIRITLPAKRTARNCDALNIYEVRFEPKGVE